MVDGLPYFRYRKPEPSGPADIDPDMGATHEVVSDTVPLSAPRWSPAGDALYYLRDENELRKIAITPQGGPRWCSGNPPGLG